MLKITTTQPIFHQVCTLTYPIPESDNHTKLRNLELPSETITEIEYGIGKTAGT